LLFNKTFILIIDVFSFEETEISFNAKGVSRSMFVESIYNSARLLNLYFLVIKLSIKVDNLCFEIVAKKPSLPVLIPTIGISLSFTIVAAFNIVPSPPNQIK